MPEVNGGSSDWAPHALGAAPRRSCHLQLPAVFVCENNFYGEFTPMAAVTAGADIAARARAYDMPGTMVGGVQTNLTRVTPDQHPDPDLAHLWAVEAALTEGLGVPASDVSDLAKALSSIVKHGDTTASMQSSSTGNLVQFNLAAFDVTYRAFPFKQYSDADTPGPDTNQPYLGELFRCIEQHPNPVAQQVDRGLEARRQHESRCRQQFPMGQRTTLGIFGSPNDLAHQVIARVAAQFVQVGREPAVESLDAAIDPLVLTPGQADIQAGRPEFTELQDAGPCLVGYAEDVADHGDGQL